MARPRNRQELDRWVVDQLPLAVRVAQRFTSSQADADDALQTALCRVLQRWESFAGRSTFRTWFLRIVINCCRELYRRPLAEPLPKDLSANAADVSNRAEGEELRKQIRTVIDALPDRQREVAELLFGEGLAPGEVAEVLAISPANVHSCVRLIRRKIAAQIGLPHRS